MRKTFLLLLLLPVISFGQMPDYINMLRHFFQRYSYAPPEDDPALGLNFAKMKDGWHAQIIDRVSEDVKTDELFWSAGENKYNALNFAAADDTDCQKHMDEYLRTNTGYQFYGYMRCAYYGYNKWAEDMIVTFGDKANRDYPDSLLESLGRAYSAIASKFSWYQYGGNPGSESDTLKKRLDPLDIPSQKRIDSIDYYFKKGIELYSILAAKNPHYQTIVGSSAAKLFNEKFHAFMQMKLAGYDRLAKEYLQSITPDENLRKHAMNYISALPANSILFTYGDNDTYPLLYLQESAGYRKDITVINASLLGFPVYTDKLKNAGLKFSSIRKFYGDKTISYFSYNDTLSGQKTYSIDDFIELIQKKTYPGELYPNGDTIYNYPANRLSFPVNLTKFKTLTSQPNFTSLINIPLGRYLLNSDFLMLDIIRSNFYSRPVYFTSVETLFKNYLQKEGIVYRLLPIDSNKQTQNQKISMEKSEAYVNNHFRFITGNDQANGKLMTLNSDYYVYSLFAELTDQYLDNGRNYDAKILLSKIDKAYNGNYPFNMSFASLAVARLKTGDDNSLKLIEDYAKTLYENYRNPKAEVGYLSKEEVVQYIGYLKYYLILFVKKSKIVDEIKNSLE